MAAIGNIIKQFDGSDELAQTQREVIESLSQLGDAKAEFFDLSLREDLRSAGQATNPTVPISSIVTSTRQVRAFTSTSAGHIAAEIKAALGAFIKGSPEGVLDGIGQLMTSALTVFLGDASASTGTIYEYYVLTEGLSVVRLDLKAWYLNVTAKSIYEKMERVSAFVAIKSVVDLTKIDFSTFLYLYQQQLFNGKVPEPDLQKALAVAKEIYKDFQDVHKMSGITVQQEPPPAITIHPGRAAA